MLKFDGQEDELGAMFAPLLSELAWDAACINFPHYAPCHHVAVLGKLAAVDRFDLARLWWRQEADLDQAARINSLSEMTTSARNPNTTLAPTSASGIRDPKVKVKHVRM